MLDTEQINELTYLASLEPHELTPTQLTRLWYLASIIIAKIMTELKERK